MVNDFGRVITAMITPFNKNMEVDYSVAGKLARYLTQSGSDGLVVCGTTGESPTLTKEEKLELFRVVVEEVGGKAVVIAGTGSNNTTESIELTQAAEKLGVDGVMLVCPYYNKPSQEGLYRHFEAIAESTHLPVMLYNVPGRTGINLLPATVLKLAEIPNIIAIKEAAGSIDQVSELCSVLPDGFSVYSGDDSYTLPMLALGAKGVVSVAAHIVGEKIQQMIDSFNIGNTTLATQIHLDLLPVFKGMFICTNPVPVKAAMNILGHGAGIPRLPLVEATSDEKDILKDVLTQANLI
ncbi:MAG: 4-hydroxy-tetrahydrodipicolinate synthase [Peptococcaceae bacterium]|nr:4-hydroxy-tetrahydrodipicolinate synthase [Peptococcaceae bacterium]